MVQQDFVYDMGLYDGVDTADYLAMGFRVVAVEANPTLVEAARALFTSRLVTGRLILESLAIVV